jgi:raffinose/stachyose/melibiose transport system permease protein
MIPLYVLMGKTLKLTNTFIGTILVYVAMTLPTTVFFFSQFIKTIPKEMEEASVMDGCGYLRMFYQIFFPLMKPITSSVIIQNMIFLWNDLLVPLILIDKTALKPIMPRVYMFFANITTIGILHFLFLFLLRFVSSLVLLLQEQFIKGLSSGQLKGSGMTEKAYSPLDNGVGVISKKSVTGMESSNEDFFSWKEKFREAFVHFWEDFRKWMFHWSLSLSRP